MKGKLSLLGEKPSEIQSHAHARTKLPNAQREGFSKLDAEKGMLNMQPFHKHLKIACEHHYGLASPDDISIQCRSALIKALELNSTSASP